MKKFLSLIMAAALALSLAACGSSSSEDAQNPTNASTNSTADSTGNKENQKTAEPEKQDVTISEVLLVDEAGVKITVKSLEDGFFGPELKLLIENDSGIDLIVQCEDVSVNGYMVDTMMSVDVTNGNKANDSLTIMDSDLKTCGIDTIADLEISFYAIDSESWKMYLEPVKVQLKTSAADTYEYVYDDSGDVVFEGNDIKIVVKGLDEEDSFFGPSIVVYIENNSDKDIIVQAEDASVNGFMIDPWFSCDVAAGKHAIDTITFMESELEENDIDKIETVELSFQILDADGWATIVNSDTASLTF